MDALVTVVVVAGLAYVGLRFLLPRMLQLYLHRFTSRALAATTKAQAEADSLGALPIREFIPRWTALLSPSVNGESPRLNTPASDADIAAAESRLALTIPEDLRALYRFSDGLSWYSTGHYREIAALARLQPGSTHNALLSEWLQKDWVRHGRGLNMPEGLPLCHPHNSPLADEDILLPFGDLDSMLILEAPQSGSCSAIVVHDHPHLPVGSVLFVEEGAATYYTDLRNWLASSAMLDRMQRNYLKQLAGKGQN